MHYINSLLIIAIIKTMNDLACSLTKKNGSIKRILEALVCSGRSLYSEVAESPAVVHPP